jgi:hypothetical protein
MVVCEQRREPKRTEAGCLRAKTRTEAHRSKPAWKQTSVVFLNFGGERPPAAWLKSKLPPNSFLQIPKGCYRDIYRVKWKKIFHLFLFFITMSSV